MEDLVDELEEHAGPTVSLKSISAKQAGLMARQIAQKRQQDPETLGIEIENGLEPAVSIGFPRCFPDLDCP